MNIKRERTFVIKSFCSNSLDRTVLFNPLEINCEMRNVFEKSHPKVSLHRKSLLGG
jgi:uncharacterized Zn-finger protein